MIEPPPPSNPDPVDPAAGAAAPLRYVALTGNPNSGKTTLFNLLTGLRAKVGNYAGVTVERKEGRLKNGPARREIRILDLPGTYSLSPNSLDEQVSRDVLFGRLPEVPQLHVVVVVVDASNLQRNLYYATQVIELGYPTLIALNMTDVAESLGHVIAADKLARLLDVPVQPIVASTGQGVPELREKLVSLALNPPLIKPRLFCQLPGLFRIEATGLADLLANTFQNRPWQATAEALLILSNENALASSRTHYPPAIQSAVAAARKRLDAAKVDWRGAPIEWRYARVAEIQQAATTELAAPGETFSDKVDRIVTHKIWGTLIFLALMFIIFQCIFTFADYPMRWLENGVTWAGDQVGGFLPPGDLRDLLVNGVIAGVGSVVVFLPQILMLFTFIGLLEDTGYMARAAFLMDRLMSRVGLHGKSFIPMLSSFACAIPGIMATRTIESPKDRLVTILVAPLMSCSARLPIYTLLIGATIPDRVLGGLNYHLDLGFTRFNLFGFLGLRGLTMLAMYLLGIIVALLMAWVFKKTLLKGEAPLLIMELPPYKRPLFRVVLQHIWERSKLFLTRAGTVILGVSIVLWFLATYPRSSQREAQFEARRNAITRSFNPVTLATGPGSAAHQAAALEEQLAAIDQAEFGENLRHSFAGRMGRAIEPILIPLGFDWKIGIGIISSFAAREVFVSTMSTVYNLSDAGDADEGMKTLEQTLREQKRPDGQPVYTTLVAVTLMVFYVFALQCASTVAIVRRETNSWKWPLFQWAYMGALAWTLAFLTYQGGKLLGWG
ncbi:MAG TPA: ferrous iron transport protein B [Verrucomicrobiota bacterium]|nr:ferrous iron transport protein B [Verrucomicrobiota bacterium]HNT15990.1 ferrous iron transport protein B [Verrucomicrobiota bacterium]